MNTRKYLIFTTSLIWLTFANIAQAEPANPKIVHLLNRLSLGIMPGEIERVQRSGVDKYIQEQLNPDSIVEPAILNDRLAKLDTINLSPVELFQQYNPNRPIDGQKPVPELKKIQQKQARQVQNQAIEARLWRSIYSQRQLNEVMVDFWYNHFNVYADKGIDRLWVGAYEQQAIRPYALGKFRDLLGATARHPGMLFYLDNWQNSKPNSNKKGRPQGLNENYARELMELHTLGVDGGYKQDDTIALAKIMTGWGFKQPGQKVPDGYSFQFNSNRHDFSNKVFLKQHIIGSGIGEGEQALNLLSRHPSTARHISFKLAQYFISDNPPKSVIDKLSKRFVDTDGDIKLVLDTLFHSPEFWDRKYYGSKFKTPYQYAISSIRSTGTDVNNIKPLNDFLKQLGMPIYGCPTPNGYGNTQEAWLNPDSMTRRINYATNLAKGKLPISASTTIAANTPPTIPMVAIDPLKLAATLGNNFSDRTQQAISTSSPEIRAALILGSPEFMKK
ncbi:DUF1800 domain-containing protein [Chamaesiphon sp. VAR_48_metabat_135_sub]|uniref:DUF1800 domain-containing protein n=1 Tax=Chamaesiphon sp. VAR_48_metabat_135_sub TaxID=2964699 RepID=UPI00286D3859|nr:DUF1800 domain-containing protein [Chamaesiphon sp. VAR_48_metabat_135_sub]